MSKEKWIDKAIKRKGAFKKKSKEAGESVSEHAHEVLEEGSKADTRTKKQATLALTLAKMRKKK